MYQLRDVHNRAKGAKPELLSGMLGRALMLLCNVGDAFTAALQEQEGEGIVLARRCFNFSVLSLVEALSSSGFGLGEGGDFHYKC